VHAKGSAAFGTLTITKDIAKYTKAKVFSKVGKTCEHSQMLEPALAAGPSRNLSGVPRGPRGPRGRRMRTAELSE
jgi:catalase